MVRIAAVFSAAALLSAGSVSARTTLLQANENSLHAQIVRDPELQKIVQGDLVAEAEQGKKKPKKPKVLSKEQIERDLQDKAFEAQAKTIPKFHSLSVVGDSYASGDGAYHNSGNGTCRRNSGAFGWRLNNILKPDNFQFLPCSGAAVKDIQYKQVDGGKYGQPDLVLFTAGGDNGGAFVSVLLKCILQPSKKKCDVALAHADVIADGLPASLTPLYQAITSKPSASGRKREILHLGYVQMYNRDAPVDQCPTHGKGKGSDVTWPSTGEGGYRERINQAIIKINRKIREAAEANGVTYIDADAHFKGHRFCDGPDASWMQHRLSLSAEGGIICHPTWEGHTAYIVAALEYLVSQRA